MIGWDLGDNIFSTSRNTYYIHRVYVFVAQSLFYKLGILDICSAMYVIW